MRESRDIFLVLFKTVRNVLFPVALLVNNLALAHDGLRIIILVGQSRAEDKEHYKSEPEHHETCIFILEEIDLHDVKCREHSDHQRRNRQAHSDDSEHADLPAVHQLLVTIGDDLFLENLLQAASGHRRHRYGKYGILRSDLLGCLAGSVRFAALALRGKCGRALVSSIFGSALLLLKLIVHGLATGLGKCCGCRTGCCSCCRSCNGLRRFARGIRRCCGCFRCRLRGLCHGLCRICDTGYFFRRVCGAGHLFRCTGNFLRNLFGRCCQVRSTGCLFRALFFIIDIEPAAEHFGNRTVGRLRRRRLHRSVKEAVVRRSVGDLRLAGIRLLDRVFRAVQQAALCKQLSKRLLLTGIFLFGSLVLNNLNRGFSGNLRRTHGNVFSRFLRAEPGSLGFLHINSGLLGHLRISRGFLRRLLSALADLADKVHFLFKGRTVGSHLGNPAIGFVNRLGTVKYLGNRLLNRRFRLSDLLRSLVLLRSLLRRTEKCPVDCLAVRLRFRSAGLLACGLVIRISLAGSFLVRISCPAYFRLIGIVKRQCEEQDRHEISGHLDQF